MNRLHNFFLVLILVLITNTVNAAVTFLAGNREGASYGMTPVVMKAAAPANYGLCSEDDYICSGNTVKDTAEECAVLSFRSDTPVECCDADDGVTKYDCFPLCDHFSEKYTDIKLFPNITSCEELNAISADYACQTGASETSWKLGCKCSTEYTKDTPPNCEGIGLVTVNNNYECKAGENGTSKYLPVNEACDNPLCVNEGTTLDFDAYVNTFTADGSNVSITGDGCDNRFYNGHPNASNKQCRKKITINYPDNSSTLSIDWNVYICACPDNYKSIDDWKKANGNNKVPLVTIDRSDTAPQITGGVCFWNALGTPSNLKQDNDATLEGVGYQTSWNRHTNDYTSIVSADAFFYNGDAGIPCKDWEKNLIKIQYDEQGYKQQYTDSCPQYSDKRKCAYAFNLGLQSGMDLYEEVSFCACKRNANDDLIYNSCPSDTLGGGLSCDIEFSSKGTLYQYCLPQCREKFVDLTSINTGCTNDAGKIIAQSTTGTYDPDGDIDPWITNNKDNLCLESEGSTTVKWQCGCPDGWVICAEGEGIGDACPFAEDGELRYEKCGTICDNTKGEIVDTEYGCTGGNPGGEASQCYMADTAEEKYICNCTDDYKTLYENCGFNNYTYDDCMNDNICKNCVNNTIALGTPCSYDNPTKTNLMNNKFESFGQKCEEGADTKDSYTDCDFPDKYTLCYVRNEITSIESDPSGTEKFICTCPDNYKTIEEYCNNNDSCIDTTSGSGTPCTYDGENKYADFGTTCPTDGTTLYANESSCVDSENNKMSATPCIDGNELKYICSCTSEYMTLDEFCATGNHGDDCQTTFTPIPEPYCDLDGDKKYSTFETACPEGVNKVDSAVDCINGYGSLNYECYLDGTKYAVCKCNDNWQTLDEYCSENNITDSTVCENTYKPIEPACTFDGDNKYDDFILICPTDKETQSSPNCPDGNTGEQCDDNGETKYICGCPSSYKTFDEFCYGKDANCKNEYTPIGNVCKSEDSNNPKYEGFLPNCETDRTLVTNSSECAPGSEDRRCWDKNASAEKYMCKCPNTYETIDDFCVGKGVNCKSEYVPYGDECTFENISTPKYESFIPICPSGRELQDNEDCGNGNKGTMCSQNGSIKYLCACPNNYRTLEEFCEDLGITGCLNNYVAIGEPCKLESSSEPKYKEFAPICPNNRPYFAPDATCENGVDGDTCALRDGTVKKLCNCPEAWVDINGRNAGGIQICTPDQEATGKTCDYDNYTILKYEMCQTKCSALTTNGAGVTYLNENEASEQNCKFKLGDGATYGASPTEPRCSENHAIRYPCYCGADYSDTCELSQNKLPPDNPITCTINGTVYYNQCKANDCLPESSTVAIIDDTNYNIDPAKQCENAGYGTGATGRRCGFSKIECVCDATVYNNLCKYPLSVPEDANAPWCKYGDGDTLMKNGVTHYKTNDCSTKEILGKCGEYILNDDGTPNYSVTIKITASNTLCKSQYGTGATPVLCEYSDNPNRRAYNCWYNENEFIWTENNCPIRHVFGTRFIYRNKLKHYDTCDCHPNYKYHKFNCNGTLSGAACTQKLTTKQVSNDTTLQTAVAQGRINVGQNIQLYGYCK